MDDSWLDVLERKDRELAEATARLAAVTALVDEVKGHKPKDAWVHRDEINKALGREQS